MEQNTTNRFRIIYLIGLILLFFSIFLEWYSFQIYNFENTLVASWSYYFFIEWYTPLSSDAPVNVFMKPESKLIPFIFHGILIGVILAAGYVILFKSIDTAENVHTYNKYAYINLFLVFLIGYYIIVCPIIYLAPHELYFPFLSIRDYDLEYFYVYSLGSGYILQLISFPLIFPYSIFYYKTTSFFIRQERAPEKLIEQLIQESQDFLDLDKYIAEEELQQQRNISILRDDESNRILTTFIEGRK